MYYDFLQIREEPPPYSSPDHRRYESFENPLADERRSSTGNPQAGTALYDFTAGGDDEVGSMLAVPFAQSQKAKQCWIYDLCYKCCSILGVTCFSCNMRITLSFVLFAA